MARLPYAARTLIKQVTDTKPRTKAEHFGDPDGLGVYRTIRFNKSSAKWLAPLLEVLNDPRIASFNYTENGYLHVTFVAGPIADQQVPFALNAATEVAAGVAADRQGAHPAGESGSVA